MSTAQLEQATLPADLGSRMRHFRRVAGLSQAQTAQALGRHLSTISDWERNKRSPDLASTQRLAALYDVPVQVLAEAEISRT